MTKWDYLLEADWPRGLEQFRPDNELMTLYDRLIKVTAHPPRGADKTYARRIHGELISHRRTAEKELEHTFKNLDSSAVLKTIIHNTRGWIRYLENENGPLAGAMAEADAWERVHRPNPPIDYRGMLQMIIDQYRMLLGLYRARLRKIS